MNIYLKKSKTKTKIVKATYRKPVLWLIICFFVVLQVFSAIQTSSLGAVLISIEEEEILLKDKNDQLTADIVSYTSLTKTSIASKDLEFIKPEISMYINVDNFVARAK